MQHNSPGPSSSLEPNEGLPPSVLGHFFWASRDAVIVGGEDNCILEWNPAAEELYGYTREEMIGQRFEQLVPEGAMDQITELTRWLLEPRDSTPTALAPPLVMPANHKSGRALFVEFSVSVVEHEGHLYALAIVRDCTDRLQLQNDLTTLLATAQETVRRAEELARLKADLSTLIAHELGNPLSAMGAMIDLLDHSDLTEDQQSQLLSSMRGEVEILQRLVEDIRSATRMERGEFTVQMEPTDLRPFLEGIATSSQVLLANHDFALEPVPDVRVLADSGRITQVLRNLISNAAKYTPPGTAVRLRARQLDGRVRIEVEDEGPGIAPEDLDHIFTKFGRGHDASGRRIPGMGLGLFLSQQIARQHGGTLLATSEPGTCTVFSFELPEAS